MPLQQANSPINLDLILVCRKAITEAESHLVVDPISHAIEEAARQASELSSNGIQVSLADVKVILMGQLLCETHKLQCLYEEEQFLEKRENDVDYYVEKVIIEKGENLYKVSTSQQLMLFEKMAEYLISKKVKLSDE